MKKFFLSSLTVILAIALIAFKANQDEYTKARELAFIDKIYTKNVNNASWTVFEYIWGPQDDPNSYVKVPYYVSISNYCPGTGELCAILAEEDLFSNPGHPTQACLDYLLNNFGYYYYFPYEVQGLVEFKRYW